MRKKIYNCALGLLLVACANDLNATVFTSTGDGAWNVAGTWSQVGDADGIPDSNDDVTIQAGHNISVTGTGHSVLNLTVNGILTLNSACNVAVWGNYALNGSEAGSNGSLSFKSSSGTISGAGTFGPAVRYSIVAAHYTVSSEVVMLKNVQCSAGNGVLINNGYIKFAKIYGNAESFINNSGATLEFGSSDIASWFVTIDATAANNTIIYSNTPGNVIIKSPLAGEYSNLTIRGASSSKRLPGNIQVTGNLTLESSGILDTDGFDLSIGGNFTRGFGSMFLQDAGTEVIFNGIANQSIINSTPVALTLNDVVFNNTVGTVTFTTGLFNISNSFTVNQGTVDVGTEKVTLQSNATKTAYIGPSNGNVTGSMIIQRFIDARADGYSDMSSPISNTTMADWENELLMLLVYNPPSVLPSVWSYSESLFDFVPITSNTYGLVPGEGYQVYLDSDGDELTSFSGATINTIGIPNMGDIDRSAAMTIDNDGWNFIGNPYAAHLDWASFEANGAGAYGSTYMIYDEVIADFATFTNGTISPTQGFWVEVLSAAPSPTFKESMKTTSTSSTFRSVENEKNFTLRLYSDKSRFTSNAQIKFNSMAEESYEKGVDLPFKGLPNAPHFYTVTPEGKNLRINQLNNVNGLDIQLGYEFIKDGNYVITALNKEILMDYGYTCAILEDKVTGVKHDLLTSDYSFDSEIGQNNSRFVLHLSKDNCAYATTHVSDLNAKVFMNGNNAVIDFNFNDETLVDVSILNALGQEIISSSRINAFDQQLVFNLENIPSSVVLITIRSSNGIQTTKLFK